MRINTNRGKKCIWEGDKGGYGSGDEKFMLFPLFVLYKNM